MLPIDSTFEFLVQDQKPSSDSLKIQLMPKFL